MANENQGNTTPPSGEEVGLDSSVQDILAFDPFAPAKPDAPPEPPAAKPADVKGGAPASTPPKDAAKPPPGAPPSPAPPAAPQKTPEQLIAEHTASIRQMLERGPVSQPAAPVTPAKPEPEAPKFNLGIPDQVLAAIRSEDPKENSLAMHAIVNGVANAVWREAQELVRQNVHEVVQAFPRIIEAHMAARQTQQEVYTDFYGTYKQFSAPEFVPLVQATALQLINEKQASGAPIQGWTAEFRDEVANRLFARFPMLKGTPQPPAPPKPRSFATGANGGARPAMEPGPVSEMLAILGKPQ